MIGIITIDEVQYIARLDSLSGGLHVCKFWDLVEGSEAFDRLAVADPQGWQPLDNIAPNHRSRVMLLVTYHHWSPRDGTPSEKTSIGLADGPCYLS